MATELAYEPRPQQILVTVREAARMLAVGRTSIYQLIRDGELEVIHIGRAARVPVEAVENLVSRRRRDHR